MIDMPGAAERDTAEDRGIPLPAVAGNFKPEVPAEKTPGAKSRRAL
jgi:hypothetical protein